MRQPVEATVLMSLLLRALTAVVSPGSSWETLTPRPPGNLHFKGIDGDA